MLKRDSSLAESAFLLHSSHIFSPPHILAVLLTQHPLPTRIWPIYSKLTHSLMLSTESPWIMLESGIWITHSCCSSCTELTNSDLGKEISIKQSKNVYLKKHSTLHWRWVLWLSQTVPKKPSWEGCQRLQYYSWCDEIDEVASNSTWKEDLAIINPNHSGKSCCTQESSVRCSDFFAPKNSTLRKNKKRQNWLSTIILKWMYTVLTFS